VGGGGVAYGVLVLARNIDFIPLSTLTQVLKYGLRVIGCMKGCSVGQSKVGWRFRVPISNAWSFIIK